MFNRPPAHEITDTPKALAKISLNDKLPDLGVQLHHLRLSAHLCIRYLLVEALARFSVACRFLRMIWLG
ncbi:hypothetical protein [Devosia sp. RR2S18]|uniref:hypothetical protein n=1 Tax=Devosia rhizosphaerae TaxID=3049774 RepID=UPI0025425EFE|nr:hypothetical protein [Devosia sp. RR2S18]WIJ24015.1 hypothetical protein QOV41_13405 [Devosia sp. RR2S18]